MISIAILSLMLGDPFSIDLRMEPFPVLGEREVSAGCVTVESGLTLFGSNGFGGISAMRFEGDRAIMVTDAATVFSTEIIRDDRGFVTAVGRSFPTIIEDSEGNPRQKSEGDSEGLVLPDTQSAFVSFENTNRIERFNRTENGWTLSSDNVWSSDDERLGSNDGIEALGQLKDGQLIAMAEGKGQDGMSPVWIEQSDGTWRETSYKAADEFNVTDVDFDPLSGDLIVVERAFSRLKGVRARLVRVPAAATDAESMQGTELARLSFLHGIDNMESIDVERNAEGELIAHLMSDDNFNDIQRTVLIGVRISETAACMP